MDCQEPRSQRRAPLCLGTGLAPPLLPSTLFRTKTAVNTEETVTPVTAQGHGTRGHKRTPKRTCWAVEKARPPRFRTSRTVQVSASRCEGRVPLKATPQKARAHRRADHRPSFHLSLSVDLGNGASEEESCPQLPTAAHGCPWLPTAPSFLHNSETSAGFNTTRS